MDSIKVSVFGKEELVNTDNSPVEPVSTIKEKRSAYYTQQCPVNLEKIRKEQEKYPRTQVKQGHK